MKRFHRHHHFRGGGGIFASLGQALNFHSHHEQQQEQQERLREHKFQLLLRDRVKALHLSLLSGGLTFGWLLMALDAVALFIREAQAMLPSDLPTPLPESDEEWLCDYLDDTVKLLDALNELRQVISDMEHRNMLLKLAAVVLTSKCERQQQAKARKCIDEYNAAVNGKNAKVVRRSSPCLGALEGMLVPLPPKVQENRDLFLASLYSAKVVCVFVLGTVFSALVEDGLPKVLAWSIPNGFPWSKPLMELLHLVKEQPELEEYRLLEAQSREAAQVLEGACRPTAEVACKSAKAVEEDCEPRTEGMEVETSDACKPVRAAQVLEKACKRRSEGFESSKASAEEDAACKQQESEACTTTMEKKSSSETDAEGEKAQLELVAQGRKLGRAVASSEQGLQLVRKLGRAVASSEQGLQLVRKQVDALFRAVVCNRNSLLNCLRNCTF